MTELTSFSVIHAAENVKGGVGTYLRDLLKLQGQSFGPGAVTVVVPASQSDILQSPTGVELLTFDDHSGRIVNAFRLASRVQELVSVRSPNLIHVHSSFAGAVLRPMLSLNRSGLKLIYCPHGWAFDRDASPGAKWAARWVERGLAPLCDAIVCVSNYELLAGRRGGIPAGKLVLIRNGVPSSAPNPSIEPSSIEWGCGLRRVLFVGRFDRQKGVDILLETLAELKHDVFGSLVGGSVLGDASFGVVPENARIYGWLPAAQLEAFYRSADLVVVPSRWEGFGLAAAEAMRAGLPVVASSVGGLTEIVENGVTGVLIPPGDRNALRETLRGLSQGQLRTMGIAGRKRFLQNFTMERLHGQLCELYQRVLTGENGSESGRKTGEIR